MLAEFNTHRSFSRNSASSRAIPLTKADGRGTLDRVKNDPAFPIAWTSEQPGMGGGSELEDWDLDAARYLFAKVWDSTIHHIEDYLKLVAKEYPDLGEKERKAHTLHKSLINRLLEPFMWHTVIVTATDWDGFWDQRCSPLAQPEIRVAAEAMKAAYDASEPQMIGFGDYHTPYVLPEEYDLLELPHRCAVSTARCARVSYLNHSGTRDFKLDFVMFDRLRDPGDGPPHWSPLEHIATPALHTEQHLGNLKGWHQLRHYQRILDGLR
jgi:hypothetical protein